MPREITIAELIALRSEGGKLSREDLPAEIKGVDEIVAALNKLSEAKQADAKAMEALALAIKQNAKDAQDRHTEVMGVLELNSALLGQSQETKTSPVKFQVERDTNGQIIEINARKLTH